MQSHIRLLAEVLSISLQLQFIRTKLHFSRLLGFFDLAVELWHRDSRLFSSIVDKRIYRGQQSQVAYRVIAVFSVSQELDGLCVQAIGKYPILILDYGLLELLEVACGLLTALFDHASFKLLLDGLLDQPSP